MLDLVTVQNVL